MIDSSRSKLDVNKDAIKNIAAATTHSQVTKTRRRPISAALRRFGVPLVDGLKSVATACCDPMTCNAYWIGAHPAIWDSRK